MSFVHEIGTKNNEKPWRTITLVNRQRLLENKWLNEQSSTYYGRKLGVGSRLNSDRILPIVKKNEKLIQITKKNCESTLRKMLKTVLFTLTDSTGVVLGIHGPERLLNDLNHNHNLGLGTIFNIEEIGINAINISIDTQEWVFMNGNENDFWLFSKWNSFCQPIRHKQEIIGYLNLSFSIECDPLLIATIFSLTVKSIENDLKKQDPKMMISEKLNQYRLSPREREIGYFWTKNYSALRIASELGISEGTVRNVIKKIYKKTNSTDKGHFISKFIV